MDANKTNSKNTHCGRCCRPRAICANTCPVLTVDAAAMAALNAITLVIPARKVRR